MEKAFQKFLIKMLSEKYPNFLDIHVVSSRRPPNNGLDYYEVFLILYHKDWGDYVLREGIKQYIANFSKYFGLLIGDIFVVSIDGDEW